MGDFTLHVGDCREGLRTLPDGCARTCVTSPPYYGLRDYGTATWEGGGEGCDHVQKFARDDESRIRKVDAASGRRHNATTYDNGSAHPQQYRDRCGKCGAIRVDNQIGLEQTPAAYVATLVEVFREVRRVLSSDGTLWLNLGDSYAANGKRGDTRGGFNSRYHGTPGAGKQAETIEHVPDARVPEGLKTKDLIGIPWRVAFALQDDGWYLRSDIIWHKPNPMPESVTDRPTKAHEYIFLLSKNARYFYDADAVKETAVATTTGAGASFKRTGSKRGVPLTPAATTGSHREDRPFRPYDDLVRNRRTVWTVATTAYVGAHFATFPPKLIEPCILAGSAVGDLVIDPFTGSGTTAQVSLEHNRRFFGTELNPEYAKLAHQRIDGTRRRLF